MIINLKSQFIRINVSIYFTFIILLIFSCKENGVPEVKPPVPVDTIKRDFSKWDFGRLAYYSRRGIKDTIWDDKKKFIQGFTLEQKLNYENAFPVDQSDLPFLNSIVSIETPQKAATVYKNILQRTSPYLTVVGTNFAGEFEKPISTQEELKLQITGFVGSKGKFTAVKYSSSSANFENFKNLKLLFSGSGSDAKTYFAIDDKSYQKMNFSGLLYIYEWTTFRAKIYDTEPDVFGLLEENGVDISKKAHVNSVNYGCQAFMAIDGPETTRNIIGKLSNSNLNALSDNEIEELNAIKVYFYLKGFPENDILKIRSFQKSSDKINKFLDLTSRKYTKKEFEMPYIGVPLYYTLKVPKAYQFEFDKLTVNTKIYFNES